MSTGTEDLVWAEDIQIFPNPSNGVFQMTLGADLPENIYIRLVDVVGKVIEEREVEAGVTQTQYYQYPNLPAGLYFLVIETTRDRLTKKVIIN